MSVPLRRPNLPSAPSILFPLALTASAGLLAMVLTHEGMAEDDRPLLGWVLHHRSAAWTTAMTAVSSTPVVVLLTVAVFAGALALTWGARSIRPLATVLLAVGGAGVSGEVLKVLVGRTRPPLVDMLGSAETNYSFPSNHSLATTALVGGLVVAVWRATANTVARAAVAGGAVVVAVLMGASRLYLGDHWLTDVLAGYALAIAVVAAAAWLTAWERLDWPRWDRLVLRNRAA